MNSFNKTKAVIFPCRLCFLLGSLFQLNSILEVTKTILFFGIWFQSSKSSQGLATVGYLDLTRLTGSSEIRFVWYNEAQGRTRIFCCVLKSDINCLQDTLHFRLNFFIFYLCAVVTYVLSRYIPALLLLGQWVGELCDHNGTISNNV